MVATKTKLPEPITRENFDADEFVWEKKGYRRGGPASVRIVQYGTDKAAKVVFTNAALQMVMGTLQACHLMIGLRPETNTLCIKVCDSEELEAKYIKRPKTAAASVAVKWIGERLKCGEGKRYVGLVKAVHRDIYVAELVEDK